MVLTRPPPPNTLLVTLRRLQIRQHRRDRLNIRRPRRDDQGKRRAHRGRGRWCLEHGKRGVFELQGLLLVGRRLRNLLVQTAHELAARLLIDAVRKLCESLVRLLPERDPVGHRGRHQDRAKTSNMLLADLAISPPRRLDDAGLQPMPAPMAKSDKHGSGTMAGPFEWHNRICTCSPMTAAAVQPVPGNPPVSKISSSRYFQAITHAGRTP